MHLEKIAYNFLEEFLEVVIIISVNMYMVNGGLRSDRIIKLSILIAGIITALNCYKSEYSKTFKTAMIISLVASSIKKINE